MAQRVSMTHGETGLRQAVPIGFSWPTFFFGFFVPLIRGDIKWAAIMFVVDIIALVAGVIVVAGVGAETDAPGGFLLLSLAGPVITNVVFAMRYNTVCAAALVERGFKPTGALGRRLLAAQGIGVRDPAPGDAGTSRSGQTERSDPGSVAEEDQTDPATPASDPASASVAKISGGGMQDGTRKVVAIAGGVLCVVAALLPVMHMPIIGAVPWSFFDGEPKDGVFVAAAGVLAILLGLLGRARGWNLIPSFIVLAVAIFGIVNFTDMVEELRSATAEGELGIFEGLADMAIASVSLGAAAPTAIVGAIVILASAVASRRWIPARSTGRTASSAGEPKEAASRPLARPTVTALGAIGAVAAVLWAIGEIGTGTEARFEGATPVSLGDTVPGVLTPEDENYPEGRTPEAVIGREAVATSSMPPPQPATVWVDQLIEAFNENEFRALETYGNRPLRVTGVVQSVEAIDQSFSGGAIAFESSHPLIRAVARVGDVASLARLSPADTVTAICQNAALEEYFILWESVGLDDCKVIENAVVVSAGSWAGDWFSHGSSVDDIAYERLSITVMGTTGFLYGLECRSAIGSRMSVEGIATFDGFSDGVDASAGRTFAIRHDDGEFWIETEARDYGQALGGCVPPDLEPSNRFTRP